MNAMSVNEELAPFKAEYRKLYESLYKNHRKEKDLLEQCMLLKVKLNFIKLQENIKSNFSLSFSFSLFIYGIQLLIHGKCFFRMKLWTTHIRYMS